MSNIAPFNAPAPVPRLWHAKLARAAVWLFVGVFSLLLLTWLTLHWAILPHIERWRPLIETKTSDALGIPVRIGNIAVRSTGWVPTIELRDVALLDLQLRPALQIPRVLASLSARSALSSLLHFDLRLQQLLVEGASLDVRRDAQGRIFVAGIDFGAASGGDDSGAADWFFGQREFALRGGSLRWIDEQRGAPPLTLTEVDVVVRNSLRQHALRLDATPPADWGERFSLRGKFTPALLKRSADWQHWSGQAYADLPRADVSALRRYLDLPFELSEGVGALRAWLDVRDGRASAITLDAALRTVAVRLAPEIEPLVALQVAGRLVGERSARGGGLALQRFGFQTADGVAWPPGDMSLRWTRDADGTASSGSFSAERLDLALMAQTATRLPIGKALRPLLQELRPEGRVSGLKAAWDGPIDAPLHYRASATIAGLTLAAKPAAQAKVAGRPGLRNAELLLDLSDKGGNARITMKNGALDAPGVFAEPLVPLDELSAEVKWSVEPRGTAPPQLEVRFSEARLLNADLRASLSGVWKSGAGQGFARGGRLPGVLQLDARFTDVAVLHVPRYLPLALPEGARRYVERAMLGGTVKSLDVHVKGDLWDFPFQADRQGEFRAALQLDDVTLAYVPSVPAAAGQPAFNSPWPPMTQLTGALAIDRASLTFHDARASIFGVALSRLEGGIADLANRSLLTLEAQGSGPLADMLRFVNATPVGHGSLEVLKETSVNGSAELKVALSLPLDDLKQTKVNGSLLLAGNDIRVGPELPPVGNARGQLEFSPQGISIVGGAARALGGELTIEGGTQPDGSLRFNAQGSVSAEGLRRAPELGLISRVAGSLSGQTSYKLALGFVQGWPELNLTSNLVGMSTDLPAPLRKAADAAVPLHYQTTMVAESLAAGRAPQDTLRFELGSVVQAQFVRELSDDAPRVLRGGVSVNDGLPTPASGVAANINLPLLDVDAWQAAATRLFGTAVGDGGVVPGGYAPTQIGLRAQTLSMGGRQLTQLVAGVTLRDGVWRANLDADQLDGYVEVQPSRPAAAGRVHARLARLSLPRSEVEQVETLLDEQPASVPALDIVVEDFELRGKKLGRVEIQAVNRLAPEREWALERFSMSVPEAELSASGRWVTASTSRGPARGRTKLDFKLELADGGAFIERLGGGRTIRGGKGQLKGQLAWPGSPLTPNPAGLSGQINVAIEAGQFLQVQTGAARLLGVLSLQSLPRRLLGDFRDVFDEGFAFDSVTGDVKIEQGVASTGNLLMRGAQATVLMEGSADVAKETQDLRVVVVPEIGSGAASLAYSVINPVLGLSAFLAQMVLRQPLIEANTHEFRITGSWSDPKVEPVERRPGQAAPTIEPRSEAPQAAASSPPN